MVVAPIASSCMRVFPRTTPLASSSRVTSAELLQGILPAQHTDPAAHPAVSCAVTSLAHTHIEGKCLTLAGTYAHDNHSIPLNAGVPASVGYPAPTVGISPRRCGVKVCLWVHNLRALTTHTAGHCATGDPPRTSRLSFTTNAIPQRGLMSSPASNLSSMARASLSTCSSST